MKRHSRAVGIQVDADGTHCVANQLGGGVGVSKAAVIRRCGEDLERLLKGLVGVRVFDELGEVLLCQAGRRRRRW